MRPPVKVGVIGTGWVATARHIPSFRRHPDVEVVAVLDRRPDRARQVAAEWGIPRFTSTTEELFAHDLDVVTICTPPWTHAELACAALERGIHVFTEKPMAMDEAEARAMVEAANAAGRLVCASHNLLFSRAVQKADQHLDGRGQVRHALGLQLSSHRRRLPDWYSELPGGLLFDESPHMLYTLQHFLGPLELDGVRATWRDQSPLPLSAEVRVKSGSGTGQVTMVFEAPISEWHIGLISAERCLDLDLFRDITMTVGSDGAHRPLDILRTSSRAILDHAAGFAASGARYATKRLFWGHDVIIARFVDAILGRGPTPVAAEDCLGVVRLTDGILAELGLRHRRR